MYKNAKIKNIDTESIKSQLTQTIGLFFALRPLLILTICSLGCCKITAEHVQLYER